MLTHSHLSFISPDHKCCCSVTGGQLDVGGSALDMRVTSSSSYCLLYYLLICNCIVAKYMKAGDLSVLFVTVLVWVPSEADLGAKIPESNLSERQFQETVVGEEDRRGRQGREASQKQKHYEESYSLGNWSLIP